MSDTLKLFESFQNNLEKNKIEENVKVNKVERKPLTESEKANLKERATRVNEKILANKKLNESEDRKAVKKENK